VIVCWRTVRVPSHEHERFLAWIHENRDVRERHGILAELVIEHAGEGEEMVVVTIWPSHEVFEAWIATPERDRLTASAVHRAVDYQPITRYDVVGGYVHHGAVGDDLRDSNGGGSR
jgi:heme-degrading monooxygenase HmoA